MVIDTWANTRLGLMILLILVWIAVIALLFAHCGSNPNFWFDESGQFWMSRGQTHFSPPLTPDGSLSDVLQANRTANSDPGGYTVGLHWWLAGGASPSWLRSFSFLFFIATMLGFVGVTHLWTRDRLLSLAAGLIPASSPLLARYAFELRAYSMEACGVILTILLLEYVVRRPTVAGYFSLGAISAFFLTSRYSFVCTAAAIGAAVVLAARREGRVSPVKAAVAYGLPVLAACIGIYLVTLGHPLSHQKAASPYYVERFILHGKSFGQLLDIIGASLFAESGSLLFMITYLWFAIRKVKDSEYSRFTNLFILVGMVNVEFLILSLFGKYPWCPQERWGISLSLLSVLSWVPLVWMICRATRLRERVGGLLPVAGFSLVIVLAALHTDYRTRLVPDDNDNIYANIMALGPDSFRNKYLLVTMTAQPSVRYLYEFGPLKKYAGGIYPGHFRFEVPFNPYEGARPYDYVISSDSIRKGEFSSP